MWLVNFKWNKNSSSTVVLAAFQALHGYVELAASDWTAPTQNSSSVPESSRSSTSLEPLLSEAENLQGDRRGSRRGCGGEAEERN